MLQHVSLEVRPEQIEACVASWRLLGFERGAPRAFVRDPAGNHVEVMSAAPPTRN